MKSIKKQWFLELHKRSSIEKSNTPPKNKWPEEWKRIYFKGYPRFERISLDKQAWIEKADLIKTLIERHSSRIFSKDLDNLKSTLSYLLLGGAIGRVNGSIQYDSYRTYPSAGARYPLELYVIVLRGKDFKMGLYHYHVRTHSLEYLWSVRIQDIQKCFPGQKFVTKGNIIIVISAAMARTVIKYKERGYRFALIEAGHLAQNIMLLAQAKNILICPIGGFHDANIVSLLEIEGTDELPLYALVV